MAVKEIIEITCDVCKRKMDNRYGVSIETGESRICAEADRPTHEIDLCHRCACKALQEMIDASKLDYDWIMDAIFPKVKRIDK
jgi:hypothetical protein